MITAAGILFRDDSRRLLLLRRADGHYPGSWALPGGKLEEGETAEQAARRETLEETERDYRGELKRLARSRDEAVDFTTFTARTDRFEPELNDEHDAFLWVTLPEALNLKLHPGLRAVLAPRLAADKAPKRLEQPPVVLKEINPSLGLEVAYRRKLTDLLDRMTKDLFRRLRGAYPEASERLALDDDPVVALRHVMNRWGRIWVKRFDAAADDIARMFATRSQQNLEIAFRKRLKDAGFTVQFRPTERMVSAYRATIAEQVGLIKSIPQQYLKDVEGVVWRGAMRGGDMNLISKEIRTKYGVSTRRAALIARDQIAKSKSVFENERRRELGIATAIWRHSHAGKAPRPSHVKMDGKEFEIAKGMYDPDEGLWIQPGQLINCRCSSRSVLPRR